MNVGIVFGKPTDGGDENALCGTVMPHRFTSHIGTFISVADGPYYDMSIYYKSDSEAKLPLVSCSILIVHILRFSLLKVRLSPDATPLLSILVDQSSSSKPRNPQHQPLPNPKE